MFVMNTTIYAKYVYLFEMDSARTSADQVKLAVRALYHETIAARNIVVLSYNQVVDSIPFISMLKEQDSFEDIFHLFELGYLKINQYGTVRTIIQYLLNQLDNLLDASSSNKSEFQFSGFPVKQSQRRLLALMRRCLVNSDLSEIYEYINYRKTDEEIRDLFLQSIQIPKPKEDEEAEKPAIPPEYAGYETLEDRILVPASDSTRELVNTLKTIAVILENILKLSAIRDIYLPPKKEVIKERRSFSDFLNLIMENRNLIPDKLYEEALEEIEKLEAYKSDSNVHSQYRSDYLNGLKKSELETKQNAETTGDAYKKAVTRFRYAETIINTCYNYTVEASILNISRHYDLIERDGLLMPDKESFYADCRLRIQENMESMEAFMQSKVSSVKDSVDYIPNLDFPRLEHLQKPDRRILYCEAENTVPRYEYRPDIKWYPIRLLRLSDFPEVARNFLLALALLILVNLCLDKLQQFIEFPATPGWAIVKCMSTLIVGELANVLIIKISEDDTVSVLLSFFASLVLPVSVYIFGSFLQNTFGLNHPVWSVLKFALIIGIGAVEAFTIVISRNRAVYEGSLFEIVGRFMRFIGNEVHNFRNFKMTPHVNQEPGRKASDYKCLQSSEPVMPLPETRAMRRYKEVRKDTQGWPFFNDPADAGYRFYRTDTGTDADKENSVKDLYRYEELTGRQFGLIHQSKFSTLLVDPVLEPGKVQNIKNLMSYERVLPGKLPPAGKYDGVVIIPRLHGRYVLITQYRHALRRDQLCFPRGFADKKCIYDDLKRELKEEIGTEIKDNRVFHFLGSITPDSGLTSKTAAVYLADLDSVGQSNDPAEAIKKSGLYTAEDIFAMIGSGEIDDGFTVSAAMFLKLELQHMRP